MQSVNELGCYYIALIRSVGLIHQNSHWRATGSNFYSQHLLFERIYKTAAEDADAAAEKLIGLFGIDVLNQKLQAHMIAKIMEDFASEDLLKNSLDVEKKFLDFSKKFYKTLKAEDKMSMGLDDFIMSTANNREGAVYLLQQAMQEPVHNKLASRKEKLLQAMIVS